MCSRLRGQPLIGGLYDKTNRLVVNGEGITALRIGLYNLAPIGDLDADQTSLARLTRAARAALVDHAGHRSDRSAAWGLSNFIGLRLSRRRQTERKGCGPSHRTPACYCRITHLVLRQCRATPVAPFCEHPMTRPTTGSSRSDRCLARG